MSQLLTLPTEAGNAERTQPGLEPQGLSERRNRRILIASAYDFAKDSRLAKYVPLIESVGEALSDLGVVVMTHREMHPKLATRGKHPMHYREASRADIVVLHPVISDDVLDLVKTAYLLGRKFIPFYYSRDSLNREMLKGLEKTSSIFETVRRRTCLLPSNVKKAVERFYEQN